ncbi:MAG: response regulator [Candidatus Thiodiazotropha sp. (ex Lucinoma annulata)]|nr:response regulator [Candidatus Thiodiazotropha sp. (ex Lucinoma borealis)]MCU7839255.1 response regulator [Candidatus Thiodiazotropha sp. (ex Troendleina suluensis)]MCU7866673.1 response regulator [Candidatus Thiodiazotropha sp. (ex Lucinoma borealis)]MCU7885028.1 response regulator [Candidatus Thiodiazotropha sp. (ex Lucinoma annulata)]
MKRLLIADDEPHVTRVLKQSLERQGYQVETVQNGEIALERIHEQVPDVLVTDIQMPRMTGEALCKRIQKEMPQREFLIFVLTSRTEIEHRDWSRQINNLQFLEKPVSIRKLISKLERYFTDQQVQKSQ